MVKCILNFIKIFNFWKFLSNPEHTTFLDPANSASLIDHNFTSETNKEALEDVITDYKSLVKKLYNENKKEIDLLFEEIRKEKSQCQK